MVVRVNGFVHVLVAVHPQVIDFLALFPGATNDNCPIQFDIVDVSWLEYTSEDVGDLLVAHAHAYFGEDTAQYGILASLDFYEEQDGGSPEMDAAPHGRLDTLILAERLQRPSTIQKR